MPGFFLLRRHNFKPRMNSAFGLGSGVCAQSPSRTHHFVGGPKLLKEKTMYKAAMAAAALLVAASATPSLAHDNDDYGYGNGHARFHEALEEAHERAHEEGFSSPAEHRAFHRALRNAHEEYHEDNYRWRGPWWACPWWAHYCR